MDKNELIEKFKIIFGDAKPRVFFAPGRVNLIGEHTDYNGGHVFPCALSFGTYAVAVRRKDNKIRMYSLNFEQTGMIEAHLYNIIYDEKREWANYPLGVLSVLKKHGYDIYSGFDVLFWGNNPTGAGLSSSASIELVTGVMFNELYHLNISPVNLALFGQETENDFIGVNSGIMDQFAIALGKEANAILLNTETLEYTYAPLDLKGLSIVIGNTNKRRTLADSKYNERRAECERALSQLQKKLPIKSLGELSIDEFEENKDLIINPTERKRAKHAVYENQRTLEAVKKLEEGDVETFGKLMNQSHISLRDDYEVTGKELDAMVEAAWEQPGVIGSRMTGAGFGGCTVSLVKNDNIPAFIENVTKIYTEKTGLNPEFYIASVGGPAREI